MDTKRKEALSKTVLDLAKIAVAAAFASEFFAKFTWAPRVIILVSPFLLLLFGVWVQPTKEELEKP
ncbi:MAG: hypothetical protein HYS07_00925 [Chlamydiae bacterium]|nr:hypothetical protein [Chlamydiota bacterium]